SSDPVAQVLIGFDVLARGWRDLDQPHLSRKLGIALEKVLEPAQPFGDALGIVEAFGSDDQGADAVLDRALVGVEGGGGVRLFAEVREIQPDRKRAGAQLALE